ncbi:MAG: hypothetical protein IT305_08220, partial [Chloroflexi bacterium]|nr:hypothetical protein [Chloroflexota bacterium]
MAWKLALVMQGRAPVSLPDTCHDERIGIARRLVQTTDRAFNYVNSRNPLLIVARRLLLPLTFPLVAPLALRQRFLRSARDSASYSGQTTSRSRTSSRNRAKPN